MCIGVPGWLVHGLIWAFCEGNIRLDAIVALPVGAVGGDICIHLIAGRGVFHRTRGNRVMQKRHGHGSGTLR